MTTGRDQPPTSTPRHLRLVPSDGTADYPNDDIGRATSLYRGIKATRAGALTPDTPEQQALQALSDALIAAEVTNSLTTNGRGTALLEFTTNGTTGTVFWDNGEFLYVLAHDPSYKSAGGDPRAAAVALAAMRP